MNESKVAAKGAGEEKQTYVHPHSPNSGESWMKDPISFKSVKITNYEECEHGNVMFISLPHYAFQLTSSSLPCSYRYS